MSREVYAPPSLQLSSSDGPASGGPSTQYLCGDCNSKVQLKKGDPIRCKECGHRVLYKERTKRWVDFLFELSLCCVDWGVRKRSVGYLLTQEIMHRMVQFEAR